MTESGIREWEIGLEGTDNDTADPDVVPDARQSHATIVSNCWKVLYARWRPQPRCIRGVMVGRVRWL